MATSPAETPQEKAARMMGRPLTNEEQERFQEHLDYEAMIQQSKPEPVVSVIQFAADVDPATAELLTLADHALVNATGSALTVPEQKKLTAILSNLTIVLQINLENTPDAEPQLTIEITAVPK
jgi:hypothetical protein